MSESELSSHEGLKREKHLLWLRDNECWNTSENKKKIQGKIERKKDWRYIIK